MQKNDWGRRRRRWTTITATFFKYMTCIRKNKCVFHIYIQIYDIELWRLIRMIVCIFSWRRGFICWLSMRKRKSSNARRMIVEVNANSIVWLSYVRGPTKYEQENTKASIRKKRYGNCIGESLFEMCILNIFRFRLNTILLA